MHTINEYDEVLEKDTTSPQQIFRRPTLMGSRTMYRKSTIIANGQISKEAKVFKSIKGGSAIREAASFYQERSPY